jgi:outer membrane protein insertion porin family
MFIQPAALSLRRGRYSEAFRRSDEENISDLYKSNGFRDVKVTTTVNREYRGKAGQVSVTVNIDEGRQWLIDKLEVTGITQVNRDEVLSPVASIAGQPFAEVTLASDRNVILTWYFAHGFPAATLKVSWQPAIRAAARQRVLLNRRGQPLVRAGGVNFRLAYDTPRSRQ